MTRVIPVKYRIIIIMTILFFVISGFIFLIREKSLEKNIIFSHAKIHIEMPTQAVSMQMNLHQLTTSMEEITEEIDEPDRVEVNTQRYIFSKGSFQKSQKKFEELVSTHNSRWAYSQEQLDADQEHKEKHQKNKELFKKVLEDIKPFFEMTDEFFIYVNNGENEKIRSFFREKIEPEGYNLESLLKEFVELQEWETNFHLAGLQAAQANIDNLIWVLFTSLFCVVLVFIYFLVIFSLEPIKRMSESIDTIISGDTEHRVEVRTKDELGVMASKFNQMLDTIFVTQEKLKKANLELSEEKRKSTSKEKMFKDLAEQSPDCIKVFDREGKIVYMSPGGLAEHGFKKEEEAIGWNFLESIVEKQRGDVNEMLQLCLSKGKPGSMEVEHLHEYANRDWCDLSVRPIRSDDGGIVGALAISRDITALKKNIEVLKQEVFEGERLKRAMINLLEDIEEERDKNANERYRMNRILHSIGDGVLVVDDHQKIVMFNEEAENISGFDLKKVIGKKYYDVIRLVSEEDGSPRHDFINEVMNAGEVRRMPSGTILVKKNGDKIAVSDSAAPIKNKLGKVVGCVIVFRDASKEREIDKAKNEFVSLASHQLRTPLTAINWYLEMLMSGDAGKINSEQKKYMSEIYNGSRRMVNLVNSLLNTSRIDLGTFAVEPEKIDIRKIADSALFELTPQIKTKHIKIEKKYDRSIPFINADKKLIGIIFQNLLSNAIKYTPAGGRVRLSIEKKPKNFIITVADNGYGIPASQQKKIFTKLFRADNVREKETDGTGLGLYIVKSVIEKTGGKISFISKENKGTTFKVELPLSGMEKKEGTKGLS